MTLTRMWLGLFSSLSPSARLCRRICMKRRPLQERAIPNKQVKQPVCFCPVAQSSAVQCDPGRAHLFSHIRANVAPTLGHCAAWASRSASTISCRVTYFSGSFRYTALIFWRDTNVTLRLSQNATAPPNHVYTQHAHRSVSHRYVAIYIRFNDTKYFGSQAVWKWKRHLRVKQWNMDDLITGLRFTGGGWIQLDNIRCKQKAQSAQLRHKEVNVFSVQRVNKGFLYRLRDHSRSITPPWPGSPTVSALTVSNNRVRLADT